MAEAMSMISMLANVVVAAGVIFVWKQMVFLRQQIHDDHERSRKETLIRVMKDWNTEIGPETAAAQKLVANLSEKDCRKILHLQSIKVSKEYCALASAALGEKLDLDQCAGKEHLELDIEHSAHVRFLVIEYLNTLEICLSAWKLGIVDLETMEDEFSFLTDNTLTDPALSTFRKVMGKRDGFPALNSFLEHVVKKTSARTPPEAVLGQTG